MKRQIKLLIENLFDDLYDIDQESDLTVDIANKIYKPELGDIYYKNKVPYSICCGLNTDFQDDNPRFMLINEANGFKTWHTYTDPLFIKELKKQNFTLFNLESKSEFKQIDENGYFNTQIIKNNYNLSKFPVFKSCCEFGEDIYLPAIDELQIMYLNMDKLNDTLIKLKDDYWENTYYYDIRYDYYWSSTQYSALNAVYINTNNSYIGSSRKYDYGRVRPFIHIN